MAGIDFIHQNGVDYEIVPEIAPLFKTTVAYHTGDHVIYEAGWYTFKADKSAGAWDATKVDGPFKVTDQLSDLKEDLNDVVPYPESPDSKYGTAGQLLRTKGNGKTEWVDEGLPTDEQTAEAVTAWLDDHPEATTTVQDGSLTEAKLSSALKLKTIKDYVTPEMFGAVGDGETDDSDAVLDAVATGKTVVFSQKYYTSGFTVNRNQEILNFGIIYLTSPIIFTAIELDGTLNGALNSCFTGGVIVITNTPAFLLDAESSPIRRFYIKDLLIAGSYDSDCKAIKTSDYHADNYVTFCAIENVKVYGCYAALWGAIRASNISLIIEQCYYPVKMNSDLNNIQITGQAMDAVTAGNDTILDITGNENNITGTFYDVHSPYQSVFCHIRGASQGNKLNYDYRILNTICDNHTFVPYYGYGSHDSTTVMNKNVLTSSNVVTTNIKDFNLTNFLTDRLDGFYTIKRIDDTQDGIIEISLPSYRTFFGFKALFYFGNYAPKYFEVYKDDVLLDRKERVLNDNGLMEWYPRSYETGYSNNRSVYKVRFIIRSEIRMFQINFFRA